MSEPAMRSPLHSLALAEAARPVDGRTGVWASELANLGYIGLRGHGEDASFVDAASSALGVRLPVSPCTLAVAPALKALWLSPDEWLIVCERGRAAVLLAELDQALSGMRRQIVDNSGGYTQVLIRGANAGDVLAHASVYDAAALEPGRVVGTTFGKAALYVHREDDGFCLVLRRSFADYIWRYLVRAAAPYGFGVAHLDAEGASVRRDAR